MHFIPRAALLACVLTLAVEPAVFAQTADHGYSLTHVIHFQVGDTYLLPGDSITISEVRGTADTISRNNLYEVSGTYKLASHPAASIAASVTTNENGGKSEWMRVQHVSIDRGSGHFTLFFYMSTDGFPHISFYPADHGESFAGVYFGTGASVMPVKSQTITTSELNRHFSAPAAPAAPTAPTAQP